MPTIQHLLETRFSVRMGRPLAPAWLEERIELLQRFTLPSVAAQTTDAFTWLLLCDTSTGPGVLEQLEEEAHRLPTLRVALTSEGRTPLAAVRSNVQDDADVLITSRLDSDDAIADRYLEATQAYAESFYHSSHETLLVNFPLGYRLDVPRRTLYRDRMPNSSFHSLFERPKHSEPKTVMSAGHEDLHRRYAGYRRLRILDKGGAGWHARLHQHYPTHQDESMSAWLIVVHGGNLVNRIPATARKLPAGAQPYGFTLGDEA
jgi:Putative rhamnosyl transferase